MLSNNEGKTTHITSEEIKNSDIPLDNNDSKVTPEKTKTTSPVNIIFIGMAGSGKTTLLQRVNSYLHSLNSPPYVINLDAAVSHVPFDVNVDIRDTVNYKQVMKKYGLGPNGGILTSLNLMTTKFDQVLSLIDKRASSIEYVLIDTPGQIEIFTWSASGAIITDSLASTYPTVIAYVIDTPRTTSPSTFTSNMLYACSILYKTKLPFIVVFNKTDVQDCDFAYNWMSDFETFQEAIAEDSTFMSSLNQSLALALDEFYQHLRCVGVSAVTGEGMPDFFEAVQGSVEEYETEYKPMLQRMIDERNKREEARKQENLEKMLNDMKLSSEQGEVVLDAKGTDKEKLVHENEEDEEAYEECQQEDHDLTSNLIRERREAEAFEKQILKK